MSRKNGEPEVADMEYPFVRGESAWDAMRTKGSNQERSLGNVEGPAPWWSVTDREYSTGISCRADFIFQANEERGKILFDLDRLRRLIELANFRAARFMLFRGRLVVVVRANAHAGWDEHKQGDPKKDRQANKGRDRVNPHVESLSFR